MRLEPACIPAELSGPIIDRFRGPYFFLSNYSPASTPYAGQIFPTSEHAYMAAGTTDLDAVVAILAASTSDAQVIGRAARNVDDWERRRFEVMADVVTAKFTHNGELGERLVATGDSLLVEGNDWHDQTWGCCRCEQHGATPGRNALGVLLMDVRRRLSNSAPKEMHSKRSV